jgi:pimeloyl-ACP methyl ester carboxylesterase
VHELAELAEESFLRSGQRISIIGHSLGRLIGRSVALRYPRAIHVITLGSALMMSRGALPSNPQQGRLAMRFFHSASAFTFFCWSLVSRPRLLEARVGSFDVIDLGSKNRRAANSNRFEQRRLSNPSAPERPNSRRIRPIRREHVRNELFLSKHAQNFRPVQLIGTVTPVPVLAGLHRAHVCDRFFAVLPGPEPGGTELEAVVLRYQLPLPPLRQRPQLQIYARMPAQALDVMQFCDSCLH